MSNKPDSQTAASSSFHGPSTSGSDSNRYGVAVGEYDSEDDDDKEADEFDNEGDDEKETDELDSEGDDDKVEDALRSNLRVQCDDYGKVWEVGSKEGHYGDGFHKGCELIIDHRGLCFTLVVMVSDG